MSAASLIRDLRARGIFVEFVGARMRYLIDRRSCDPGEGLEVVRALRERFEERAAILEFDAGYVREEAERLAWEMTLDAIVREAVRHG